jgi:hypothetical protein
MTRRSRGPGWLALLTAGLALSVVGIACEHHHYYRAYDPYYTDYHQWNGDEQYYYRRWADETHHNPHRDFRKLPPAEQKEYWTWRHNHSDRDRDHDRDRDRDQH